MQFKSDFHQMEWEYKLFAFTVNRVAFILTMLEDYEEHV